MSRKCMENVWLGLGPPTRVFRPSIFLVVQGCGKTPVDCIDIPLKRSTPGAKAYG